MKRDGNFRKDFRETCNGTYGGGFALYISECGASTYISPIEVKGGLIYA